MTLALWNVVESHHLERQFLFSNWASGMAFANRVSALAEELNHHPELVVSWGKVIVRTWSHDTKSITERDHQLARKIDAIEVGP